MCFELKVQEPYENITKSVSSICKYHASQLSDFVVYRGSLNVCWYLALILNYHQGINMANTLNL